MRNQFNLQAAAKRRLGNSTWKRPTTGEMLPTKPRDGSYGPMLPGKPRGGRGPMLPGKSRTRGPLLPGKDGVRRGSVTARRVR